MAANEDYEFNRQRYEQRLAQLSSGVAVAAVGGVTQTELWERKGRMERAVRAARAAQAEGVVPGGGTAYLRLIPAVCACAGQLPGDEKLGAAAVARALEAPAQQIIENAGQNAGTITAQLKTLPEAMGYDAENEAFADMLQAGILDPLRVTRAVLRSALSVAAVMLTAEACVTLSKEG